VHEDALEVNHALVAVVVEEDDEVNHMNDHMDLLKHLPLDYNRRMVVEVDSLNDWD
jgi:hypothetical protein